MSEAFHIRPIQPIDNEVMAGVIRAVMPEFGAGGEGFAIHDPEVDGMHAAYATPGSAYFVVECEGKVMGGGGIGKLQGDDGTICELRKMYFLPELRGRGAGRALMTRCLQAARELGYRQCYIETLTGMDGAQALYLKSGFKRIPSRMGATGHFGCNLFYLRELDAETAA
ncbi:GNAT family N-acetyltransferase [Oleiagrimonas soli]|uniref:Acetyltransferase n=1 Tax=Oleiagrimonas soli TaxID=1543381 RepID=A0A099CWU4_9GAMM|nr:GNAT family N-acetyltransferase [Oleiagrimonas soli]KGI78102.1 acetyltransferase [Oleiagrimonas soli]MBB6183466.1 putative acetyltransferase [Oleiagrimonas soli]